MSRRRKSTRRPAPAPRSKGWQLDWHIPVATILAWTVTAIAQGAVILWWAAGIDSRVAQLEDKFTGVPTSERVARIEERLGGIAENVKDVKDILEARRGRNS
jgi:hypothetical protein